MDCAIVFLRVSLTAAHLLQSCGPLNFSKIFLKFISSIFVVGLSSGLTFVATKISPLANSHRSVSRVVLHDIRSVVPSSPFSRQIFCTQETCSTLVSKYTNSGVHVQQPVLLRSYIRYNNVLG